MKRSIFALATVLACVVTTGCSTYAVPRYSASADNISELRKVKGAPVTVGAFQVVGSDVGGEIMCRGVGPIKTPDGETYANYVRKAFVSELTMVDMYDVKSPVSISGDLTTINFNSQGGEWDLALLLKSSNGRQLGVSEKYKYVTSFYGETACNQTAQAGLGAVQNLINNAVRHPDFAGLLR